jgi:hypothetical protein
VTDQQDRGLSPAPTPSSDPLALLDDVPVSEEEARYIGAARAANTLRGYRSDWKEWCSWVRHTAQTLSAESRQRCPGT